MAHKHNKNDEVKYYLDAQNPSNRDAFKEGKIKEQLPSLQYTVVTVGVERNINENQIFEKKVNGQWVKV